ncbi:MAG TPA: TIGR03016 family PEP-CTERM system-associated outer membrane protein, partial [Casimicrobiaceae bacterium]
IDRAQEAQQLLHGGNIPSDLGLPPDFVVGSPYVERRQQASVAFLGVRNTLMFSIFKSTRDILGLGQETTVPTGLTTNTREWGAGLTYSHRLSGFSTLTASSTWSKTDSTSGTDITSTQWNSSVGIATLLGRRTTGSLVYRYTHFDSDTGSASDYRENALIASLLIQF